MRKKPHFPRAISRRILNRAAKGQRAVVVLISGGTPTSVWGFDEYLARREMAKQVKPWEHRRRGSDKRIDE